MPRTLTLAAVNFIMQPLRDFDEFASQVKSLLDASEGADLVVFPEMFTCGLMSTSPNWPFDDLERTIELAAFEEDVHALFASESASRNQHILAGSTLSARDGSYSNLATLHGPHGVLLNHMKTQLIPDEQAFVSARGSVFEVADIGKARVGINICYEIQFADSAAKLADQGVDVLLCPSLTIGERGFWRVRHSAHARAIEHQMYVVHSASGGQPNHALPGGFARSAIISPCDRLWKAPNGILVESATNVHTVIVQEVDLDALQTVRTTGETRNFADRHRT